MSMTLKTRVNTNKNNKLILWDCINNDCKEGQYYDNYIRSKNDSGYN
jgi:hypothetical protein